VNVGLRAMKSNLGGPILQLVSDFDPVDDEARPNGDMGDWLGCVDEITNWEVGREKQVQW